jgi:hypothetical protein
MCQSLGKSWSSDSGNKIERERKPPSRVTNRRRRRRHRLLNARHGRTYTERLVVTSASGSVTVTTPRGFKGNVAGPMAARKGLTSCVTSIVRVHQTMTTTAILREGNCFQHSARIFDPGIGAPFAYAVTSRVQPRGSSSGFSQG